MSTMYPASESKREKHFYDLDVDQLFVAQESVESNARSYPRRIPLTITHAEGSYIYDSKGRKFIDCLACAGALPLGHNHPEVAEAAIEYLQQKGPLQALDLTTPAKNAFIDRLYETLPEGWRENYRIQFCGPGGSDAVEAATKLVKYATGRENVLSFHGAYHGMSQYSLGLTGNLKARNGIPAQANGVHFLPYPYVYRSSFGKTEEEVSKRNFHYIRNLLHDPESGVSRPAGIIMEAIQGEGGVIPAPKAWLRDMRELTRSLDIPMIIDEVQTGLGRTGQNFAFEYADIEPDVLVLSKALGGGFPMSVVLYHSSLDKWHPGSHAGTFRGNQIAMISGAKTMQILERDSLPTSAAMNGEHFKAMLESLQSRFTCIGDVRGRGLMLGLEIVFPDGELDINEHPKAAPQIASSVQFEALRRGLILEPGGRHSSVLRFLPPLNTPREVLEEAVAILEDSFIAALPNIK
ncbi:MAG: diaminobutyrate--2-oxoglutarate transaminase family protein [Spirochaetota bacterium]